MEAVLAQRPFELLCLRTRRSDRGPLTIGGTTRSALEASDATQAARQLQACALWMQRPPVGEEDVRNWAGWVGCGCWWVGRVVG